MSSSCTCVMLRSLLLQQLHGLLDVPRAALQGSARLLRLEAHVDQHVQRRRLQEQLGRRVEVAATALQRSATGGHVVAAELPFARLCRRRFRLLFDGFPLIFLGFQGESSPFRRLQRVSRASDSCCACSMALSSPLLLDLCPLTCNLRPARSLCLLVWLALRPELSTKSSVA